ncbi:MerR family transcriptional regulator [Limimaricola cinnabarinus]|uniref:MerR family transcriptional regulator n=1 Tax=Limimaricola cinnabarinus TaxID=1125964 RepID=UPI00248F65BB|nr:MerR family transcriptional regulator [Limimaricola cinnabarinus]
MAKSAHAFRTIGEVSDALDTPAHVLRFWESKFAQVRPVKRAGGRRYYRPEDLALLCGIKALLHDQGMTIKGVQKLLREKGVRHVADHGLPPAAPPRPRLVSDRAPAEDAVLVMERAPETAAPPAAAPAAPATSAAPVSQDTEISPISAILSADRGALAARAARIAPLVERLAALRDRMIAAREDRG